MEKKIRIGVIGCGNFGNVHMKAIVPQKNAELVAICDVNEENLKLRAKQYDISEENCYTDYKELLKRDDIDAITVPLPDQAHRQITVDALHAGKHVFCEKPMALTSEDCKAMIQAQRDTGKHLMIGQVCRYAPSFNKAKELILEGEIGELFFVESEYAHDYSKIGGEGGWRVTPERQPIIGGGCHAVDLLRWIAGNPSEVFAYANRKVLKDWPVNDCFIAVMKFPNDVVGKVFTSIGCKRPYTMRTVLYGSKGTIICDNTSSHLSLFKSEMGGSEEYKGSSQQEVEIKIPVVLNSHNAVGEIEEFCDVILSGREMVMNGEEGAATVAVCEAIVNSAATGQSISLDYKF